MSLKSETRDLDNEVFLARILQEKRLRTAYNDSSKVEELLNSTKKQRMIGKTLNEILNRQKEYNEREEHTCDSMQVDIKYSNLRQSLIQTKKDQIAQLKNDLKVSIQAKLKRQELEKIAVSIKRLNKPKLLQDLKSVRKTISEREREIEQLDQVISECKKIRCRVIDSMKEFSAEITKIKETGPL